MEPRPIYKKARLIEPNHYHPCLIYFYKRFLPQLLTRLTVKGVNDINCSSVPTYKLYWAYYYQDDVMKSCFRAHLSNWSLERGSNGSENARDVWNYFCRVGSRGADVYSPVYQRPTDVLCVLTCTYYINFFVLLFLRICLFEVTIAFYETSGLFIVVTKEVRRLMGLDCGQNYFYRFRMDDL